MIKWAEFRAIEQAVMNGGWYPGKSRVVVPRLGERGFFELKDLKNRKTWHITPNGVEIYYKLKVQADA